MWSKDSSADGTSAHGSPGSPAHTVPQPLPLVPLVGDPKASSAGLGCTWLLPKASKATYFRQQYKNTRAGPKGRVNQQVSLRSAKLTALCPMSFEVLLPLSQRFPGENAMLQSSPCIFLVSCAGCRGIQGMWPGNRIDAVSSLSLN